ncbi:MAG TPA: TIGR03435 family protein [Bryobacteraceae bacterium]|nr:TIGR03435 family protein [Bryobacteraceae bacterium]
MRAAILMSIAAGLTWSQTGPLFDAASVKALPPGTRFAPIRRDSGRVSAAATSLQFLIGEAWGVGPDQVTGPDWLSDEMFSVVATFPDDTPAEQFQMMLQNLLAERFHLAVHRERKTIDGYDLVIAKGGPKLKESTESSQPRETGRFGRDGATLVYTKMSISRFAGEMPMRIRQANGPRGAALGAIRVIDKTGLAGDYDFSIHYAREGDDDPGPDLFAALETQVGLKLQPEKIPLDFIVVDRAEKSPGEN